jgi:hypothetical protein
VAGKIKQTIERIVEERSKGSETIKNTTRTKLILKGININAYTENSEDNSEVMARLQIIAGEMGVKL